MIFPTHMIRHQWKHIPETETICHHSVDRSHLAKEPCHTCHPRCSRALHLLHPRPHRFSKREL
jgi:hypothetical protein